MLNFSIHIFLVVLSIITSWRPLKQLFQKSSSKKFEGPKLPPSPPKLPIIGHLYLVGRLPHRSFQKLAKKYGPIMHLKLGAKQVIVVSSPDMAERLLRSHDVASAKRPMSEVSYDLSYGSKGIIFTPYSPYWRNMRKLCVMELLSASKTRSFGWLRVEEVGNLVNSIKQVVEANQALDVGNTVGGALEDLIYRILYGSPKHEDGGVKGVALEGLRIAGTLNVADFFAFSFTL